MDLKLKKCVPCEGGLPRIEGAVLEAMLAQVSGWSLQGGRKLQKRFLFDDFVSLMAFVGRVAELAEAEAHHPDFCVHYSVLDFEIWTHAISGLSENDFILAAKIDALAETAPGRA
ncbi:MAG: 4a-hydroxytetrahydrobiopterin dehydratase [Deltaproteobacteria bacterium]|nr:4a-hydroxytetrahydrobiopterin dehydratase [Deltaproteobacteria bacterium]